MRIVTPAREGSRGAIAIIFAISTVMLLGVVATVVDIGLARQQNAQAQAAADSAALGGARELSLGSVPNAVTMAQSLALENGFPTGTIVTIPPATGTRVGDPNCIEVSTADSVDTIFGRIYGQQTIDVGARAVACGRGSGGIPAIFANSQNCNSKTLTFSGSDSTVLGGVHSNDELHLPGSTNNFFGGNFDYVSILNVGGSGNNFDPGNPQVGLVEPLPVEFDIADYQPGGVKATAATVAGLYHNAGSSNIDVGWLITNTSYNSLTGEVEPGLYFTSGLIDLSASDLYVNSTGVTFVSSGDAVKLAGSDQSLSPWDSDQLLVFSDYMKSSPVTNPDNCDSGAVEMNGSNTSWAGIVYAPRGQVKLNGSSNTTLLGAVVAHTVEVSGSTLSIDSGGLAALSPGAQLVE